MPKITNELTIALDGEVTPRDLAKAAKAFATLLETITQEVAPGVQLEWVISDLRPGSSVLTAECRSYTPADAQKARKVVERGERFGEDMQHRNGHVSKTSAIREVEQEFRSLTGERLLRVRMESPLRDYVLAGLPTTPDEIQPGNKVAFGSVRGRVQAMNSHGSLRFTLYDVNEDKAVSCYLVEGADSEQMMLGLWGKLVEVEGLITRDGASGKPHSVREIEGVTAIETTRGGWRGSIGAAPGFLGDERSEDIIRRARDA